MTILLQASNKSYISEFRKAPLTLEVAMLCIDVTVLGYVPAFTNHEELVQVMWFSVSDLNLDWQSSVQAFVFGEEGPSTGSPCACIPECCAGSPGCQRLPSMAKHPNWLITMGNHTLTPLGEFPLTAASSSHLTQRLPAETQSECPLLLIAHTSVSLPTSNHGALLRTPKPKDPGTAVHPSYHPIQLLPKAMRCYMRPSGDGLADDHTGICLHAHDQGARFHL